MAALVCALALPAAAAHAGAAPPESRYSFEAFTPKAFDDARLPEELRRVPDDFGRTTLAEPYGLKIAWSAREHAGLLGYRITAHVAGGSLSALAAQWRVEAGSGAAVGFSDALHYELWLPLSVNAESRVEALIEAIGADGRPIVLAVRQAHPWTIGRRPDAAAGRLANVPSNTPSPASEIVIAPQGVLVASATFAALERTRFAQIPQGHARALTLGTAEARGPPCAG